MERGLMWLPLLGLFIWLAWAGWNEYQKVEAYRLWAEQFDKSKYDIYAVLGQKNRQITWGKPTRSGVVELQNFTLEKDTKINLKIDGEPVSLDTLPNGGRKIELEFQLPQRPPQQVPFTEVSLAAEWAKYLTKINQSN